MPNNNALELARRVCYIRNQRQQSYGGAKRSNIVVRHLLISAMLERLAPMFVRHFLLNERFSDD